MKYNLADLFKAAFGIRQPIFMIPDQGQVSPELNYSGIQVLPDYYTEESDTSWLGTPILFPATFMGGPYLKYRGDGTLETVDMPDFKLPPATLFSFRRAKNIVRTEVLGGNGTVKELYGFDDWIIDVRGIAFDEPTQSAHQQIESLLLWEQLADSVAITGRLFTQRRISRIVMNDWTDNITQGAPGSVAFQFQMVSDQPIELEL